LTNGSKSSSPAPTSATLGYALLLEIPSMTALKRSAKFWWPAKLIVLLTACACVTSPAFASPPTPPSKPPCAGPQQLVATLAAHPTTENAVLLGSWYASRNKFGCAVDIFQGALKRDPSSAQLHYLTGLALFGGGREPDAITQVQQATRLDPTVIKPHLVLAELLDRAGKHADGEEQWKQALAIDPASVPALEGLSTDLLLRKDSTAVIKLLYPAPRTEPLAMNIARAYGLLNYPQEANQALADGLKLDPKSLPLAQALAAAQVRQHRFEDAINILRQALVDHPGDPDAEFQLFRTLVMSNHINEARPLGPKLLAQHPHDPEVLFLNGVLERVDEDYPHARAHLEEAESIQPNDYNIHYNLGILLVYQREWQHAVDELKKSIALGEPLPEVHFQMARALRGLGDDEGAKHEVETYQQLKKADAALIDAAASERLGDKDLDAGDPKEAILQFRKAVDQEPDNANYKYRLSVALHQSGDLAGEQAQLEQAVKLKPDFAEAQKQLGYLLDRSGDPDAAVEHFRAAVKAAPEWVEAWINLSAELAATGQLDEARQAVATALHLEPANPTALKLRNQLAHDPRARQSQP
jgi:tetratricopeptide (TPR) repeat protein